RQPALNPGRRAHPHPPQLDEPGRGRLIEFVALAVGRERKLIQLSRTLAADDVRRTPVELQPHVAGDVTLRLGDERVQRVAQRAEPQPVVDHLRPLLSDEVLEPRDLLRQRDVLQRLVGLQQKDRGGRFVDLARLDADEAVLEVVYAPDAVFTAYPIQCRHELEGSGGLRIHRDRDAFLEADLDVGRLIRTLTRITGPRVDVLRRLGPRVFEDAGLDRPAPPGLVRRAQLPRAPRV